jgi:carbamoyltransferase
MKEIVNTKIKFREPFRPFAPVVLEERAPEFYSGLTEPHRHYPFRYMLMVFPVVEEKQPLLPAVTHEGGSGRLQTIRREWNPRYYRVVERFGDETGIPILLNTSFNLRGEPIVTTPENALNTFSKSGIDTLYIDDFVVRKG